ncbi:hypothetical protein B7R87_30335 [Streptomyces tsukubensis]|uniref:Peptidase inhibitor family I36 n=2 Tax=Streptomyces tsukubensis TaxID=83656 RepID=A0A7G3UAH5_STRT9|nr:hypothetical protein B7R87_30335 [Streptomyces tsukubensis]QKM66355.1 hypothetical protein STSU_003445 [Streptomyces tsukubensis NRRL18488]
MARWQRPSRYRLPIHALSRSNSVIPRSSLPPLMAIRPSCSISIDKHPDNLTEDLQRGDPKMSKMKNFARIAATAGSASLMLFSTLGAGVSQADQRVSQPCPSDVVCFYSQPNYQGVRKIVNFTLTPGCDDKISARSVINNRSYPVGLYVDRECTQFLDQVDPGHSRSNLIAGVVSAEA